MKAPSKDDGFRCFYCNGSGASVTKTREGDVLACRKCKRTIQKGCPHREYDEDGITCLDCNARPWTFRRVSRNTLQWFLQVFSEAAKVFLTYTIASVLTIVALLVVMFLVIKKLGLMELLQ